MVDLNEVIRQTRAEVLAECIGVLEKHREYLFKRHQQDDQKRADELLIAESTIKQIQPAAKDLEELLREAELEAVKSSPECWHYNTETDQEFMERYFSWRKNRIAKLEKARAILVKG